MLQRSQDTRLYSSVSCHCQASSIRLSGYDHSMACPYHYIALCIIALPLLGKKTIEITFNLPQSCGASPAIWDTQHQLGQNMAFRNSSMARNMNWGSPAFPSFIFRFFVSSFSLPFSPLLTFLPLLTF